MKKNDVLSTILAIEGAQMARQNNTNFVVIPSDEGYVKVAVGVALAKDTKTAKAFNAEAAIADYKAWEAESKLRDEQKANKPTKTKAVNTDAQARRDALDNTIADLAEIDNATATDILTALNGKVPSNVTVMAVGSSAMRLVDKGVLKVTLDAKGKKHYTKA